MSTGNGRVAWDPPCSGPGLGSTAAPAHVSLPLVGQASRDSPLREPQVRWKPAPRRGGGRREDARNAPLPRPGDPRKGGESAGGRAGARPSSPVYGSERSVCTRPAHAGPPKHPGPAGTSKATGRLHGVRGIRFRRKAFLEALGDDEAGSAPSQRGKRVLRG